jgi:hypothetical protein
MKFSMTGQEKRWPFNKGDYLTEVTAWAGLTAWLWESKSNYVAVAADT